MQDGSQDSNHCSTGKGQKDDSGTMLIIGKPTQCPKIQKAKEDPPMTFIHFFQKSKPATYISLSRTGSPFALWLQRKANREYLFFLPW
jgi:hypothetical protein